jgi:2-iminobutanoate/2-iminopropanoate deaminase
MKIVRKTVATDKAPAAIGPYSQAVWANDILFVSGQIPIDPKSGEMSGKTAAEQAEQVLKNVGAILESQGLSFASVVKATVFAKDMNDFKAVNDVYASYFAADPPARAFVEVARLPKDSLVEIEVIAVKG